MRAGHPLADKKLTLERFLSQQHLLVEPGGSGHQSLERALVDAAGRNNIRVCITHYLSAPHLLLESDMLWIVPIALAKSLSRHYPLVQRPLPLKLPELEIGLYWHDRFHRAPQNRWFREIVAAARKESAKA